MLEGGSSGSLAEHLIGVVDLRGGRAVHAVAGRRDEYQAIDQAWCRTGNPIELAESYFGKGPIFTAGGLYVADLDAILNRKAVSQGLLGRLCKLVEKTRQSVDSCRPLRLWIDSGTVDPRNAAAGTNQMAEHTATDGLIQRVVGTESISDFSWFCGVHDDLASNYKRPTISVDLRAGTVISPCNAIAGATVVENIAKFMAAGFREFIVLDLATVGSNSGPNTVLLCSQISSAFSGTTGFRLISGGGVRHAEDARQLVEAGCEGVLVASWLHRLWSADYQRND